MADPALELRELEEEGETVESEDEIRADMTRSIQSLCKSAERLKALAAPLRRECTETAELAIKCAEAVGEI